MSVVRLSSPAQYLADNQCEKEVQDKHNMQALHSDACGCEQGLRNPDKYDSQQDSDKTSLLRNPARLRPHDTSSMTFCRYNLTSQFEQPFPPQPLLHFKTSLSISWIGHIHTFRDLLHVQGEHFLLSSLALSLCSGVCGAPAEATALQILTAALVRNVPRGLAGQIPQSLQLYL